MEKQDPKKEYVFNQVQLFKTHTLGTGSYGVVCKAKCDQLICAAKLLYPVLFQSFTPSDGKEYQDPLKRFKIECQFLSRINHPNIVQYLGTYHDPENNAPVLLMELMDESLTHFLESSPGYLPYHVQVNFSYDIAQALAFLHSNGIIHRDLSSNNVLLLASTRAKVADFGVSKFIDLNTTQLAIMTTCPGTPAFMSPEALDEPPIYTEKLDNFSFGVLLIQIVTRQFPKPTDRFKKQQLVNPKFPNKFIEAKVSVSESERRQAHIDLIPSAHPLLPTALHCLKDSENLRPTAIELCQALTALKEMTMYKESSRQDLHQLLKEKDTQMESYQEQLRINQEKLMQNSIELQENQEQLIIKRRENDQLSTRLEQATQENRALRYELQKKENTLVHTKILTEENTIDFKQQQHSNDTYEEKATRLDQVKQDYHILQQDNWILRHENESREAQLRRLYHELQLSEENCTALQQEVKQRNKEVSQLRQELVQSLTSKNEHVTVGSWQSLPTLPGGIWHGSSAVLKNKAYFKSSGNTVYEFSNNQWKKLPPCPNTYCTIVSIDGMLTAVGGEGKLLPCNKLFWYIDNQWARHFPSMQTARRNPAAVYSNNTLVVAGGQTCKLLIKSVEILNIVSRQWSSVSSIPGPIDYPSATICQDYVYIHSQKSGSKENSMYKCSLEKLIQSETTTDMWVEIAPLPVSYSSFVTVDGHVLAVGGEEANGEHSNNIYQYINTSWIIVGHTQYPRSGPLTAALPGNKLMVVGGANMHKKSELATIIY